MASFSPTQPNSRSKSRQYPGGKPRSRGTLIQWGHQQNEFLLLAIDHACKQKGLRIPWSDVGGLFREGDGDAPSESAIQQHLGRMRHKRLEEGLACPAVTRIRKSPADVLGPSKSGYAGVSKSRLRSQPIGHPKRAPVSRAHDVDDASDMDDDYVADGGCKKQPKGVASGKKRVRGQGWTKIKREISSDETISEYASEDDVKDQSQCVDSGSSGQSSGASTALTSDYTNGSRVVTLPVSPKKLRQFATQGGGFDFKAGNAASGAMSQQFPSSMGVDSKDYRSLNAMGWGLSANDDFKSPHDQSFQPSQGHNLQLSQHGDFQPAATDQSGFQYDMSVPFFPAVQNDNFEHGTIAYENQFLAQPNTGHAQYSPLMSEAFGGSFGHETVSTSPSFSTGASHITQDPLEYTDYDNGDIFDGFANNITYDDAWHEAHDA